VLTATRTPQGDFRAAVDEPLRGRWYLSVAPAGSASASGVEEPWQLSRSITLPAARALRIDAGS
jgi:hypothetical protein